MLLTYLDLTANSDYYFTSDPATLAEICEEYKDTQTSPIPPLCGAFIKKTGDKPLEIFVTANPDVEDAIYWDVTDSKAKAAQ